MYKFTNEIKTKWLNALKSGQYLQGRAKLKYDNDGIIYHCCLGVLAEVCNIQISANGAGCDVWK